MLLIIIYLLAAYVLGSIPFGLLIGRSVKGIDIRQFGSKNIGATNVFRVVGKKWGIFAFFLDALKGYLAITWPAYLNIHFEQTYIYIAAAVFTIAGHSFPIWLSFRGGKGVAVSLGVFLALTPVPALLSFGLWIIIFLISHIISMASLTAAVCFPVMIVLTMRSTDLFPWIFGISLLLMLFIFYTHRENVRRLLKSEEKKLF